ncbi:unnamed protein product [Schistosoma curassoni]|uniref:Ig-like domain-containing protein n=1 Tax=Schistosoma curassoni TaxID=6186 RepID=A0A183L6U6_9TREM|nr:unnamed protein product [Schistosoma curassoni]
MWNKIGEEYPLTIGNHRFIPDKRISIKQKSSNKWILRIIKAKLTDSGLYTCTIKSIHKEDNIIKDNSNVQNNNDQIINQTNMNITLAIKQMNNPDYYISVDIEDLCFNITQVESLMKCFKFDELLLLSVINSDE